MVLIKILEPYANKVKGFTILRLNYHTYSNAQDHYYVGDDAINDLMDNGIKFEVIK